MTFLENLGGGFQFILSEEQANICDKKKEEKKRMKLIALLLPMIDPSLL